MIHRSRWITTTTNDCRDCSETGFKRYLSLAIVGRNMPTLGRLLIAKECPKSEAAQFRRKAGWTRYSEQQTLSEFCPTCAEGPRIHRQIGFKLLLHSLRRQFPTPNGQSSQILQPPRRNLANVFKFRHDFRTRARYR